MATTTTEYGNVSVLTVNGELTVDTIETFTQKSSECLAKRHFDAIIDCSSLTQIDSVGMEALVDMLKACEDESGAVKLCGADETTRKILEITRLDRRFEMYENLEAAVQSFA